jgi:acetate kinase
MKILVLDCKEYAIRFSLVDIDTKSFPSCGKVSSIGMAGAIVEIRPEPKAETGRKEVASLLTHRAAIEKVLEMMIEDEAIHSKSEIEAVAHRVVHGGEYFKKSQIIDDTVIAQIRALRPLAPLHNPAELEGITAAMEVLPDAPHVANFDTTFHSKMPDHAYVYGLPYELYQRMGIRRYGFHGLSHRHLMHRSAKLLGKEIDKVKLVTCHLGSGCSITAIDKTVVQDTSMGFTPTEGLVMESRCGDIDPGLIPFLLSQERLNPAELLNLFNKFSGLRGLCGWGEMKTVLEEAESGNEQAKTAIEVFCYRIRKYISAYLGVLNGADAITFSAGIGLHSPEIRAKCLEGLQFLGVKLDSKKNKAAIGREASIEAKDSTIKVFVIPDNEELTMAFLTRDAVESVKEEV